METLVVPVAESSNTAMAPLAKVIGLPAWVQLPAVARSQLPLVKPVQMKGGAVMVRVMAPPLVARKPPAPLNVPKTTAGAEPLFKSSVGKLRQW